MSWLFEQLRPKVDLTALHDDDILEGYTPPPPPPRWKALQLPVVITAIGLLFIAGAITIGVHVDWALTGTVTWKSNQIWAWVPMLLMTAVGGVLAVFGSLHFRGVWKSYPRRHP